MILGPHFLWLHFPKCAGLATERALHELYGDRDDVHFDPLDPQNVIWHQNVAERQALDPDFVLGTRKILCGIRRLPHWVLSRVHFEAQRPPHHVASRAMLVRGEFFERGGSRSHADRYIEKYDQPPVDVWIRTEFLVDDLAAALGIDRSDVERTMQRTNTARIDYIRDLSFWFTPRELDELYASNPRWARLEERLYGGLLKFDGAADAAPTSPQA